MFTPFSFWLFSLPSPSVFAVSCRMQTDFEQKGRGRTGDEVLIGKDGTPDPGLLHPSWASLSRAQSVPGHPPSLGLAVLHAGHGRSPVPLPSSLGSVLHAVRCFSVGVVLEGERVVTYEETSLTELSLRLQFYSPDSLSSCLLLLN